MSSTIKLPEVGDVAAVFGAIDHLPKWDDIPEEFQRKWSDHNHPWCGLVSQWFFEGLDVNAAGLVPKEGIDQEKALKALNAILRSWAPKHEHKIAGTAYLMSQWFDIKKTA